MVVASVDQNKQIIESTKRTIPCDTVLFSVGLIPENELLESLGLALNPGTKGVNVDQFRQTEIEGLFACGNTLQVHDLVDFVSYESEIAGQSAARYINGERFNGKTVNTIKGKGLLYVLPQRIDVTAKEDLKLFFRPSGVFKDVTIKITENGKEIYAKKKKAVTPGEMETITIRKEQLSAISNDILVEVLC